MSNDKSRQTKVNNEIILLRQFVRQARVCVISRLVREAKKLRAHRGNEKQLERNKNKADKLLREVYALKDIKDDEISKFGIINFDDLQDMLKNSDTDDVAKAMIKIARYKRLNEKILKFKEKFPDYREFICQGKTRDSTKRKGSSNSVRDISEANRTRNRLRNDTNIVEIGAHKGKRKKKDTRAVNDPDYSERAILQRNDNEQRCNNELSDESSTLKIKPEGKESKLTVKVISKEAAVKRFVEVLGETDTKEESNEREEKSDRRSSSNEAVERRKRIDDFFLSLDEAGSTSDAISLAEGNDNRRVSELDRRAFKAVRAKSKEEQFCEDKREMREKKGRKAKLHGNDITRGPSNRRKMSVTRSEANENTRSEKMSRFPKSRIIETTIEAEDENLHPSWAARKKQQEMLKQGFQGKKIKFDEY